MSQIIITLSYSQNQHKDLALPFEVPSQVLGNVLAEALHLELHEGRDYRLARWDGKKLHELLPNESLADVGAMYGDNLQLIPPTPQITKAYLQAPNGRVFPLAGPVNTIGRSTPNRAVEVDLTDLDPGKVISRRHASLEIRNGQYVLLDIESLHGTQLNDKALEKNRRYPLQNEDQLQFGGKSGVHLKFLIDDQNI